MRLRTICAIATTALALNAYCTEPTRVVPLSGFDLTRVAVGWSDAKADRSITGAPLSMRGVRYASGIGVHANSVMRIGLSGEDARFSATVGVDDSADGKGSVRFSISANGRELWRSGVLTGTDAPEVVDLSLSGVHMLELRVDDATDGSGSDHADWAGAMLTLKSGADQPRVFPAQPRIEVGSDAFPLWYVVGVDGRLYQSDLGPHGQPEGKDQAQPGDSQLGRENEAYPQAGYRYVFEPAISVVHADGNRSTILRYVTHEVATAADGTRTTRIVLRDPAYDFTLCLCTAAYAQSGVLEQWVEIRNNEPGPIRVESLASSSLVLSPQDLHLLHFNGDWADEMNPTLEPVTPGTKVLDSKLIVRSHQYGNPAFVLTYADTLSETNGTCLAGCLAWSGNYRFAFDHTGKRVHVLSGLNPYASAFEIASGEAFTSPRMIWARSEHGLGGMSRALHRWARDHGVRDGHEPRDILLNNWEATGFDFDFDRIRDLFAPAARIGTELFLLDDGWFGNAIHARTSDHAGLGDWQPNRDRLPEGLEPLASAAIDEGLRFGIWLEPEMVNPRSDLFAAHPDWVIQQPGRPLELSRNQLVLDLTNPDVQAFAWDTVRDILNIEGVSYAKWDANRYVTQPGSPYLSDKNQTRLAIDYTASLYDLMRKTAETFPDIELMLCSGGGGRVDYGALRYFHEFWPSDNTDAARRVRMQWDYSYFYPAIMISSHVTHMGGRPLHFACAVAMSGRFGMDLDLGKLSSSDLETVRASIEGYKQIRDTVQLGDLYRLERPHDAPRGALMYTAPDASEAVVFVFQLEAGDASPVYPRGLEPGASYLISEISPATGREPLKGEGETRTGRELMERGIVPNCSDAFEACVIRLTRQADR